MYMVRRRKLPTDTRNDSVHDVEADRWRRRIGVRRGGFFLTVTVVVTISLYLFLQPSVSKREVVEDMPVKFQQKSAAVPIRTKQKTPLRTAQNVPMTADEQPVAMDDDADKLDFSAGHNVHKAYRLGDVFVVWYLIWQSWDKLMHNYATAYPNTLAHLYLLEVREAKYAHRNLTALLNVMDRKERTMHYRKATEEELVVHLRLGDVLTDPEYADLKIPIQVLWNQKEGFVNFDARVKSNYNKAEFEELVSRIPKEARREIKKCVICGAGFITNKEHGNRNQEYKELVHSFLRETLQCEVSYYASRNPDKDLMYMASAHWLITAMGGFAQIAAACVTARRGHAIYDKFNGEIAGWNDKRFTKKEKKVFRQDYVD